MEITVYDCSIGTGSFHVGKSWCSVCSDLVACRKTSSPLMLGISGLVAYLPMTLFSPLAGIAADRYNRKFISIFSDMAMGTVALIYAAVSYTHLDVYKRQSMY